MNIYCKVDSRLYLHKYFTMNIIEKKLDKFLPIYIILFFVCSQSIIAQPIAEFTADTTQGCSTFPLLVNFESLSTGNIDNYLWDFGDPGSNATSSIRNPSYTYRAPGCYDVTLIVSGPGGTDSITKTCFVELFLEPTPAFTLPVEVGCAPFTTSFQDNSIANSAGGITDWIWTFSDGSSSQEENPEITFLTPGEFNLTMSVTNSNGCRGTQVFNNAIQVLEGPTIDFEADVNTSCTFPLTVNITNNTAANEAGNLTYRWFFPNGDPAASTVENPPPITYNSPGLFDVTLITSSDNGCEDTLVRSGFVGVGEVVTDFEANITQGCVGDSVSFTNASAGGVTSYLWDFGDGITSTEESPVHIYRTPGTFTVQLQADNPDGCGDVEIKENLITIVEGPTAAFTVDKTSDCLISSVFAFSDSSLNANFWLWDFGDGNTSTQQNPTHSYSDFGSYTVCLTVTNDAGCTETICRDTLISLIPPDINFEADVRTGCSPLTVNFTDLSTEDDIVNRLWILPGSDLGTSTEENPVAVYDVAGDFNVSLVVETGEGCIDTLERTAFIEMGDSVSAEFETLDTLICIRDPAQFTTTLPNNPDTTRWEFSWDFEFQPDSGFNEMSTEQNPSHTYSDTGTFNVALVIKDFGCTDTIVIDEYVTVQAPRAQFGVSDTAVCDLPTTVEVQDQSIRGEDTQYQWFLDDFNNLISTDTTVAPINFTTLDSREIILVLNDNITGCADTVASLIAVSEADAAIDIADGFVGCRPYDAEFNLISNSVASVQWDFGNGLTSSAFNPIVTYEDTGTFDVNVTLTNSVGCEATEQATVIVTGPSIDFEFDTTAGCAPFDVQFTDLTIPYPGTTITDWTWNFGPGTPDLFSNAQNPLITFVQPQEYTVRLTVTDSDGCTDFDQKIRIINASFPVPEFFAENDTTCLGVPVQFIDSSQGVGLIYEWDFGDGSPISTLANPSHDYAAPGEYTVSLKLTDINGCVDSITKVNFVLVEELVVDFDGDPRSQFCPPMFTEFTNLTQGTVAEYRWDFGDNSFSTLEEPAHIYLLAGNYDVKLVATHVAGCQDSLVEPDFIQLDGPIGEFTVEPTRACLGDTVTLTLFSQKACTINADYRDGVVETQSAACILGETDTTVFKHVYEVPNQYSVLFTIQDAVGCAVDLTVPDSIIIFPAPTANFSPQDTLACIPANIPFVDLSVPSDTINPINSWSWDFGNGETDSVQNPLFSYNVPGQYDVQLVIADSAGCVDSVTQPIQISSGIIANFTASDSFGCSPFDVDFQDISTIEPAVSWFWDFGDGDTSNLRNPSHTYTVDGVYSVSLAVFDELGCSDTIIKPEFIQLSSPTASISSDRNIGCSPEEITFFAEDVLSDTTISTYDWCITDSIQGFLGCFRSRVDSFTFDFREPGTYTVALEVGDIFGCTGISDSITIRISERLIPDPVIMNNVTVEDERTIFLSFSPYEASDFVSYIILRSEDNGPYTVVDTISDQLVSSFLNIDQEINTSEHVYCYKVLVLNTCEELSDELLTQEHCTILLETSAGEKEIELNWTPYVGFDIEEYEIFRLDPNNSGSLISLGVVDGGTTTFLDTTVFCRDSVTYKILAFGTGLADQTSFSNESTNAPSRPILRDGINVVTTTVEEDSFIRVEWIPFEGDDPFAFYVEKSQDRQNWDSLTTVPFTTLSLDDFEVNTDEISYFYRVFAIDECGDTTPVGNFGRSILLEVNLTDQGNIPNLSWNPYQRWPNGVRSYQIEIFNETLGIWELIGVVPGNETSFIDNETELEQASYCYRITAVEAGGFRSTSLSNESCIIFGPQVYIPNAFSPNGDGDNDIFFLAAPNVESGILSIYNRWGRLLYRSLNIENGWDGTFEGQSLPEGVYVYVLDALGEDGTQFTRTGSITLIR